MALQNYLRNSLRNKRGQILIETLFLVIVVIAVLLVFKQLIEFKKSKKNYRFSKSEIKQNYFKLPEVQFDNIQL